MQSKITRLVATIVIALSLFVTPISAATYNITQSQPLSWNASYKVAVNNNKITNISGLKVSVAFGKYSTKTLLDSSTSARIIITRYIGPLTTNATLHIKLSNGKLVTSVN